MIPLRRVILSHNDDDMKPGCDTSAQPAETGFDQPRREFFVPFPTDTDILRTLNMATSDSVQAAGPEDRKKLLLVVTDRDILFHCPSCQGELVVDKDGAGMEVVCSHCEQQIVVPPYEARAASAQPKVTLQASQHEPIPAPSPTRKFDHASLSPEQLGRRLDELKHQLKENRSQDTEMRGHVNRATMELHRLQLRLKKLQERQADIQAELQSIQSCLPSNAA